MKRRAIDWIAFAASIGGVVVITLAAAALLNFTGDCASPITSCGESGRKLSFVVLVTGLSLLLWIVIRFLRGDRS